MLSFARASRFGSYICPKRSFGQTIPPPIPLPVPPPVKKLNWVVFQRVIRVVRVVFVSVTIYQVGYQNGMVHFAQDPKAVEEELIKLSLGIDAKDTIENHVHAESSSVHKRVRNIGNRIITAAKDHSAKELAAAQAACAALSASDPPDKRERLEAEKLLWEQAVRRLKGNWTFVLCKSPQVNAFVSGFAPRKVFVFDGLISKLKLTDDELAMIIGHEMSHVVLGHVEEQTPVSAILLGTQLILMSLIDPIGLGSFIFDIVVSRLGRYVEASYSRQHEFDADQLGLVLTSLACFDINAGASVHGKLAELSDHHSTQLGDTHPSSSERQQILITLAETHEKQQLLDPRYTQFKKDCAAMRTTWKYAVWGATKATVS
jgi:hypothetical protein